MKNFIGEKTTPPRPKIVQDPSPIVCSNYLYLLPEYLQDEGGEDEEEESEGERHRRRQTDTEKERGPSSSCRCCPPPRPPVWV